MEKFSSTVCSMQTRLVEILSVLILLLSFSTQAQNRPLGFVYSENLKGGTALFGNTLMNAVNPNPVVDLVAMNGNSANGNSIYDNGTSDMQYVDIDGTTGAGAGTRNSSSADLILPAGTNTIKLARLYWGGRAATADFDMSLPVNQRIKIRKGTSGVYQEYAAAQIDRNIQNAGLGNEYSRYQAYVDITALVRQQGAGTYTVGNGAFSTGIIDAFGNYGAWGIMIVYENPALSFGSVRVYDGFQQVYSGGSVTSNTTVLTGLNVPSGPLATADAKLGLLGWEGDSRYNGDFFKINDILFSNAINPANNPWNGTISSNGSHVTTKNPNYTDQFGIDIDEDEVGTGYGILADATSIKLELGTTDDQFFCGVITFVVKMKEPPVIKLTKTVTDANSSNTAEAGEILTYTLKGKNIGIADATAVVLSDSLPSTVTFVNGSLNVNYGTGIAAGLKSDAANDDIAEYVPLTKTITFRVGNGANAVNGGTLIPADSFEVAFQVTVNTPSSGTVPPVVNVARLNAVSSLVGYVDDATAIISPVGGLLPVTLTSFTAGLLPSNQVKIAWSTSMEYNSKAYDIERSSDGIIFNKVATKPAHGNSSLQLNYAINDDITAVTASTIYYRLKQIDINGKVSVSKVISVKLKKSIGDFVVSPNPFRNNVNINIEWNKNETTVVKVFNITGTEVISKNISMIKGFNYIGIDELSKMPAGNYVIQFTTSNGKLIKQLIKQ